MSGARVALASTCLVVAGLGVWFAVARWDQANKVATIASALGAVAAVGVAVWVALRGTSGHGGGGRPGTIWVSGTGKAVAKGPGSSAVTGVRGKAGSAGGQRVRRTADAEAEDGGSAVSGVHLD